jgi:ABC-type proline/glycine betaine transport system substrate-binding protein
MKKSTIIVMLILTTLLMGCATADKPVDNEEAYQYLITNIDDSTAIKAYLEKGKNKGEDINAEIMGGDTVLMIAARYTTNIEVLEVIVSYFPEIHKMNYKTDMSALDYLSRRENVDELYKYLMEESVKYEMNKKVDNMKTNIVKTLFN